MVGSVKLGPDFANIKNKKHSTPPIAIVYILFLRQNQVSSITSLISRHLSQMSPFSFRAKALSSLRLSVVSKLCLQ